MKSLTILNILMGIILMLGVAVMAKNITWGFEESNESLLASKDVFIPAYWLGTVSATVSFPDKPKLYPVSWILSRIVIVDWGNFYYADLTELDDGSATVIVKSRMFRSLNFTVQFFGKRF